MDTWRNRLKNRNNIGLNTRHLKIDHQDKSQEILKYTFFYSAEYLLRKDSGDKQINKIEIISNKIFTSLIKEINNKTCKF